MSRVNLKCDEQTRERLQALKSSESWDDLLNRLAQRAEDAGRQHCAKCGDEALVWTVVDGELLCDECSA